MHYRTILIIFVLALPASAQVRHAQQLQRDQPAAHWSFVDVATSGDFQQQSVGQPETASGPVAPEFPLFDEDNSALKLNGRSYLRIADPGENSPFDFDLGDGMTIEAWVAPTRLPGGYSYIIGKGRTYLTGQVKENHNWALRLQKKSGGAGLSFLFRSRGAGNEYHRWESNQTFSVGDGWHHVALTYTFGKKGSVRGYIDGERVTGKWGLGGDTNRAPMVNDDEVWIGSAMGGKPGSSFVGRMDEIAIHRRALPAKRIAERYRYNAPRLPPVVVPQNKVLVEILERVPNGWNFRGTKFAESFTSDIFAFPELPKRYNERGVHTARPTPFLVRAHADVVIPSGKHRILFRSREMSRLFVDDQKVAETQPYKITIDANGPIWELDRSHSPNIRPLQRGDRQAVVEIDGDDKPHRLRLEILVGLRNRRPEMGDASVSIADAAGDFRIVSFGQSFDVTDDGWSEFCEWNRKQLIATNKRRRDEAGSKETEYWKLRHDLARQHVVGREHDRSQTIDQFVDRSLAEQSVPVAERLEDLEFLRRVALDTIGTIPRRAHIEAFLADPPHTRRARVIDRLLDDEGWADHWVGYWQDVLAENPNIVNPSLNNTGPFRWWIHESFLENKPFDRFVTELVMMEGGKFEGGPAGFGMASENDVPMAAKSHIIGQAFLGIQMQCARCHDAPSHDVQQRDLFSLAAMLKRGPEQVPMTSSIDVPADELAHMAVKVTLKPGSKVPPAWAFPEQSSEEIPSGVLRKQSDSRERLAALLTLPQNERFAKVMVNRIWHRYLGRGLVEYLDDWEGVEPSHPKLLEWLANEFIASGYDIKHIARLILNSRVYQRAPITSGLAEQFAGPQQRRLTAEQLLDSMFVFSGKPYNAGLIAFDIDGARPATLSLNLGSPRRAWMLTSTSNERDRPGLAMPFAQPFVTFLEQFGWRGARQAPINERPDDLTALQPAEFANGVLARRACRLSDDHQLTQLALKADLTVKTLAEELHLRLFTRRPTLTEARIVTDLLSPGFETRRRLNEPINKPARDRRGTISWSNHLEEEASTIKQELEQVVRRGDLPTKRLDPDWRERLEDLIWSMMNSPEFRFSP